MTSGYSFCHLVILSEDEIKLSVAAHETLRLAADLKAGQCF